MILKCPHCGHEIPTPIYAEPNNAGGSHVLNIPFDTTGCAPVPLYNITMSSVCSGAGLAGGTHPINLHYIVGDSNGTE